MKAVLLAALGVLVLACKGDPVTDDELLAALGKDCGAGLGCDSLTACGNVEITYHICEFDCNDDPTTCPTGSFCSKNGTDSGHYCMRECTSDADCLMATGNDTLKCNNGIKDDGSVGALVCGVFP